MKASIVIPAYNEEKYLPLALESIRGQTFQDFELIVVDCFSEDKTVKIAEEYGAKVLQFYKGNIGATRRAGALAARGKYIISTSADVLHDKHWLENHVRALEQGYDMCFGPVYYLDAKPYENIGVKFLNEVLMQALSIVKIPYAVADNMSFNKKFYFSIGGFKPMPTAEDTDILKRAYKNGKVKYLKEAKAFSYLRRIRDWGWAKFIAFHTKNFIKYNLFGSYEKSYEFLSSQIKVNRE